MIYAERVLMIIGGVFASACRELLFTRHSRLRGNDGNDGLMEVPYSVDRHLARCLALKWLERRADARVLQSDHTHE